MVLLGAWQLLLGRYSGQFDFTVGVPNATRNQAQIQDLVGFLSAARCIARDWRPNKPAARSSRTCASNPSLPWNMPTTPSS